MGTENNTDDQVDVNSLITQYIESLMEAESMLVYYRDLYESTDNAKSVEIDPAFLEKVAELLAMQAVNIYDVKVRVATTVEFTVDYIDDLFKFGQEASQRFRRIINYLKSPRMSSNSNGTKITELHGSLISYYKELEILEEFKSTIRDFLAVVYRHAF